MRRIALSFALAACGLAAAAGAHASSLIGDSVHAQYLYPDTSSVYSELGTAVVTGVGPTYSDIGSVLNVTIKANQIVFNWTGGGVSLPAAFDGVEFTDTTTPFTSATLNRATNTPGIIGSEVTLVGGSIFVDLNNGVYSPGQNVTVDVNGGPSSAPEPAAWALMLLGVSGVGAMARRGRALGLRTA